MRLLIVTQAVDQDDPILGFFHRWIEEFAKHADSIEVICLKLGRHALLKNVRVHSLGKERGRPTLGSFTYAARFLRLAWRLRRDYDTVFVHMNPIYLAIAGPLWRFLGKRTGLWYTHKSVDIKLRIGALFANVIFTASPESFRLSSKKLHVLGHGIDTAFFSLDPSVLRNESWLSVGRLMKSKRHDLAIEEAARAGKELRIAGEGFERERLEELAKQLGARVVFLGPLSREQLREEYRRDALLIHRSETGSLDKVVLEAAACGLPVDSSDPAIRRMPLSPEYVRREHSLSALIPRILSQLV